ncbi:hypothetical protein AAFN46_04500 [Pseudomonas sp. CAU 1711]|uniref:hypothetical protein n=1 Tax=Pseudomonas sp. CAU 1711 TaxID=3140356 RepID=UPI0032612CE0
MSEDSETGAIEVLDDQQRIAQLEQAGKLNRMLILALAGALLLNLISWVLVAALGGSGGPDEETLAALASRASVESLQKEVGALQLQSETLQQQLKDQQKTMLLLQKQATASPSSSSAPAAASEEPNKENVQMLARTLIGQERNYQQTLIALKEGMRELAGMTPGSRSWLAFYEESLAKPMADSQARVKALEKWSAAQAK